MILPIENCAKYRKYISFPLYYDTLQPFEKFPILIVMSIDRGLHLSEYSSMNTCNYAPLYHKMLSRNFFGTIYSAMLQVNSEYKEKKRSKKRKKWTIVDKFQNAFYPGQDLSLDDMMVKWKGTLL